MKTSLPLVSSAMFASLAMYTSPASATVVTFDDLTGHGFVPVIYDGVNWGYDWEYYDTPQTPYTPESGMTRVYTVFNDNPSFSFLDVSVFEGAYFSGYPTSHVSFSLYDEGVLVATTSSIALSSTPQFLASGYSGDVTKVVVNSFQPNYYVMDNVTYDTVFPVTPVTPVPEPEAWILMLMGVGGVGFMIRRAKGVRNAGAIAAA